MRNIRSRQPIGPSAPRNMMRGRFLRSATALRSSWLMVSVTMVMMMMMCVMTINVPQVQAQRAIVSLGSRLKKFRRSDPPPPPTTHDQYILEGETMMRMMKWLQQFLAAVVGGLGIRVDPQFWNDYAVHMGISFLVVVVTIILLFLQKKQQWTTKEDGESLKKKKEKHHPTRIVPQNTIDGMIYEQSRKSLACRSG
jgi:hypothetical protein